MRAALSLLALTGLTACAPREAGLGLASLSAQEAAAVLQVRAGKTHASASMGTLILTSESGERVTLDFAARSEVDRFRLRAWRFGEAVLDVTSTPEGAWLFAPEEAGEIGSFDPDELAQAWRLISGGLHADALLLEEEKDVLVFEMFVDGLPVRCRVDRAFLRPTEYRLAASPGAAVHIEPGEWLEVEGSGSAWPRRVRLASPRGRIDIRFKQVELNPETASSLFDPPARAVRRR